MRSQYEMDTLVDLDMEIEVAALGKMEVKGQFSWRIRLGAAYHGDGKFCEVENGVQKCVFLGIGS